MTQPSVPSMGGTEAGAALRRLAAEVPKGQAVVEVGAWLGAGTLHLAQGIADSGRGNPLHIYDRFRVSANEARKASGFGVTLTPGQDTVPFVRNVIAPTGVDARFHKGDLLMAGWREGPIGLYVDDAAKNKMHFLHVVHCFGPSWVPGQTVLVLMDFHFWKVKTDPAEQARYRFQTDFIAAHAGCFEALTPADAGYDQAAFFRYTAALPFDRIERPAIGWRKSLKRIARAVVGKGPV